MICMPAHKRLPGAARRAMVLMAALSAGGTAGLAQSIVNPFGGVPETPERGGFYMYNVSAFTQYSSRIVPLRYAFSPGGASLESDEAIGGSATFGWNHPAPRGQLSLVYSPSYIGMVRYSQLNSLNQTLSFSASRKLRPRWSFGFSTAANDSTIEQYLFAPTLVSSAAAIPATAADLNAALLNGTSNNNQLASLLTGATLPDSPARSLLYGARVLTATAKTNLVYAYSPRTSLRFGISALRLQNLPSQSTPRRDYLIPHSTAVTVDAELIYLLSPSTQTGLTVTSGHAFSRIQDAYTTTFSGFVGKPFSMHWFAQAHGGLGTITPVRQTFALPNGLQYLAGGSLGYRRAPHTLIASITRTIGDVYAYGAGSTLTTQAAWNWHRAGSGWALYAGFGQQRIMGIQSRNVVGWIASAGLSRDLSPQLALQAQYAYLSDSLTAFGIPVAGVRNTVSQHSVRVALVWSPMARLPR